MERRCFLCGKMRFVNGGSGDATLCATEPILIPPPRSLLPPFHSIDVDMSVTFTQQPTIT